MRARQARRRSRAQPRAHLRRARAQWTLFLGDSNRHIFDNIESNIKTWKEQGEAALGKRAEELKAGPKPGGPRSGSKQPSSQPEAKG